MRGKKSAQMIFYVRRLFRRQKIPFGGVTSLGEEVLMYGSIIF